MNSTSTIDKLCETLGLKDHSKIIGNASVQKMKESELEDTFIKSVL